MDIVSTILGIINKFIPDPDQRAKAAAQIIDFYTAVDKAQAETNTAEASNPNWFVAGWRPFIGWCCGLCFVYGTILQPILSVWFKMPPVDTNSVYMVLGGMLGIGGMRAYEKASGVKDSAIQFFRKK